MATTEIIQLITEQEIAEAIRCSTLEVFSMMLGLEIAAGPVEIGEAAARSRAGVVALLGFAGDWAGSGTLCCEGNFGCKMASQLLASEYSAVNEDVLDAIAEVANMVIGNVKTALEQKLGVMGMSTPTVIYGRNFETRSVGSREWVTVPFTSGEDTMAVQISIAPNPRKDQANPIKRTTLAGAACPYCGSYSK